MPTNARQYLIDRFNSDAATLRMRARTLHAAAQPMPGPDAETSLRMAEACERVAILVAGIRADEPEGIMMQSIATLRLPLEELAREHASTPHLRAVFAGASTRIGELLAAGQQPSRGGESEAFEDGETDEPS